MPKVQRRPAIDASIRLVKLLGLLPRAPEKASTRQLRERLAEAGYDVDLRSIQRDLIRLSAHFPITSDDAKPEAGWQWVRGAAELTAPQLDDRAALAWVLAGHYLDALLPEDIKESLRPRFEAAKQVLAKTPFARTRRWAERVIAKPKGFQLLPPVVASGVSESVQRALLDQKRLLIQYLRPSDDEPTEAEISVLGLVVRGHVTYLVSAFWKYNHPRLLAMHRILEAIVTDEPAREPTGFDFTTYTASAEIDWVVGKRQFVAFDAPRDLIRILTETPLSKNQRMTPLRKRNWYRVTAEVNETIEIKTWLHSLGKRAQRIRWHQ